VKSNKDFTLMAINKGLDGEKKAYCKIALKVNDRKFR
jgi:hypothetical protein